MPTWINDRGDWGAWAKCPDDAPAVCGIKSRIDNGYPNRYNLSAMSYIISQLFLIQFDTILKLKIFIKKGTLIT